MTDSESQSLSERGSRNSATYSIYSLDDVPVRKSAVQIIRERSTDLIPPGSPRKRPAAAIQITKLVLQNPPTSPPRRKVTPVVIKSIQTYTSSALTSCGQERAKENRNHEISANKVARKDDEFKIIPLMNAGQLLEQFEVQKNERNQASSEFQNYLVESLNKQNRERAAIQISNGSANLISTAHPEAKVKSCNSSSATTTMTSTTTTSSSNHAATAPSGTGKTSSSTTTSSSTSSEVPPPPPPVNEKMPPKATVRRTSHPRTVEPEVKKEKSYDPQRAREYIKEQQAKRKQEKRTSGPPACEKELIRKRLEDLRKNTQVLVSKNVQKARKRSLSANPGEGFSQKSATPLRALGSGGRGLPPQKLKLQTPAPSSTKSSVPSTKRSSSLFKADLSVKMGIMRKPEDVPLGDVLVSPLRVVTPPSSPKFDRVDELGMRLIETSGKDEELERSRRSFLDLENELKLDVPEVTLVPDAMVKRSAQNSIEPVDRKSERKEYQHEQHQRQHQQSKPIPPWLKHTLIQPDPYPFIVAVRKKLEAACNHPVDLTTSDNVPKANKSSSQRCEEFLQTLNNIPYVNKNKQQQQQRSNKQKTLISQPNTTSDISSIKSDFILSLPPLSSTKIDTSWPPQATSMSSSVQPQVSPLSVERISNLKITENSLENINFSRGDDMPNADLIPDRVSFSARHVVDLNQSQVSLNTSEKQRNFLAPEKTAKELECQQMLEAFKLSLSQFIEVDQQLQSKLKKPSEDRVKIRDEMTQTTPPVPTQVATANGSSNYTDDFERSASLVQKSDANSSADSTPQKSSFTTTTSSSTEPTSSTTTVTSSDNSPEDSPSSKTTHSNESQLLDSRSFVSLSDSHNTNPPMPEEYLPSFEESLRRQEIVSTVAPSTEKGIYSSSIETQISEELNQDKPTLRDEVKAVQSVESISMKISVESDISNEISPPKVDILKPPTSSASSSSKLEAMNNNNNVVMTAEIGDSEREEVMNDTTMGSDILAMFNRTDLEISIMSTTVSEANLSYSSIGMYDQLIQSEKSKTDQLALRTRLKEKALLDRTKGQLAWLELQKQSYRERGMIEQISTTKKKQRAILVRLERERAELNRIQKAATDVPSRTNGSRSPYRAIEKLNSFSSASNSILLRKSTTGSGRSEIGLPQPSRKLTTSMTTVATAAVRGVELEPSESLEDILQRREQELQKRRQHVQALLEWHRKLDEEEQQIREIERNLLQYNRDKVSTEVAPPVVNSDSSRESSVVALERIRSIEASLGTLKEIPDRESRTNSKESSDEEVVASGSKLNRLWFRLTGVREVRYDPGRSYSLTKGKLESLYEEAKAKVLEGFRAGDESMKRALLDQSLSGINSTQGSVGNVSVIERKEVEGGSDTSSFKTTVTLSEMLVAEKDKQSEPSQQEATSEDTQDVEEEVIELEQSSGSLPDVDEIISRVGDITDNMKDLLSSTMKLDEIMQYNQENVVSESIEFHTTIEDEQDSSGQNHYSTSFDAPTIEEQPQPELVLAAPSNDSQLMIEDTSLPPLMDESFAESIPEASDKITASESLEEASSTASSATTPTTAEETETEYNEVPAAAPSELEKRLVQLNDKLGELNDSFERSPLMRSPEVPRSEPSNSSTVEEDFLGNDLKPESESSKTDPKIRTKNVDETFPNQATPPTSPPVFTPANHMPDIINEAEVLRRQELQIEQEIKQLEQQVVFLREIPNKPPPPYIPPANGSPLALIFPSEQRIDELIEDRTRELFCAETNPESLTSDHVTNIYEKLILDMCKELYADLRAPTPDVSFRTIKHDKRPLAFYNPPDQLTCLQSHIKRKIKRILNEETLTQIQSNQHPHCPMPFLMYAAAGGGATGSAGSKRKRDQVDEILAQEMFDEEPRWTHFEREEIEVKERIVDEITKMLVSDALQDMEGAWREARG